MFELEAVTKSFVDGTAVDGVDLSIRRGETTVLIGPSGCGKSTLLRLMLGLVEPTSGKVRFESERVLGQASAHLRRRMGYVIQGGGLFPHLTARENVALPAESAGWGTGRIAARIDELSEIARIDRPLWDRYPLQISGGQRQRIALLRALMLDPQVLLLDEPLGALDPIVRSELQDELKGIFDGLGKTVVLVTHDLGEAAFFGDTIVLLRRGRVVQEAPFDALLSAPADAFVTRFIGAQTRHSLRG